MKKVISTENLSIKMWCDDADEQTMTQAKNLANLPFAFKHICLLPDAHAGYGMPIGGVLAAENAIVPNAVGVDIGCGMCAVKTNMPVEQFSRKSLNEILDKIRSLIPSGFNHQKEKQDKNLMPQGFHIDEMVVVQQEYNAALTQLGTLGGGNHFIEIQKDEQDIVWIMIHSGSRNIGLKVAEHYNSIAKKINALLNTPVNPKADLAFLPVETKEAQLYFSEMEYCTAFALANRKLMMQRIQQVFSDFIHTITFGQIINIAHNYAVWEEHFGKMVVVHRKGATSAKAGETGIIPGSQGTKSYIVEGLGNPESFMSCSHGAGRVMSRNQAIKNLNLEEEIQKLNTKGIIHSISSRKDLDEASSAYKSIDDVMRSQSDLVKIKYELSPLAVIKG